MKKLEKVCELKHKLIDCTEEYVNGCGGIFSPNCNAWELGQVVDMIKDLSKVEKDCMEAEYYSSVVEAMEDYEEHDGRSGYDRWRYSSGRYAPKGHGSYTSGRMGYPAEYDGRMPAYMNDMMRSGYPMTRSQSGTTSTYRAGYPMNQYGSKYQDYQDAKRHYHESRDSHSHDEMNHKGQEHMNEMMDTVREMWDDADIEQKKHLKQQMSHMLAEMTV